MKEKLDMTKPDHFFIYPKDKNGKPTGHTICIYQRDGKNFIGEAICSESDTFNKQKGRELALERAMSKGLKSTIDNIAKAQGQAEKTTVSEYGEECDLIRYPGEATEKRSRYTVHKTVKPGYKYDNVKKIVVSYSKKSPGTTKPWLGKDLATIESDGNGVDVTLRDSLEETHKIRLDYGQMMNLKLALQKYAEHMRYGKYVRIKR